MPERGNYSRETCVAIATGSGGAARAVIRIAGPRAKDLAALAFLPSRGELHPKDLHRGTTRGTYRMRGLHVPCPCTLWIQTAPRSFTGDDVVELHVPGAPILLDLILKDLISFGARLAEPGEFTRRAFESGRMDLVKVEATLALLQSEDDAARRHAAAELDGGLTKLAARLKSAILGVLVPLELQMDFSDQDVEIPVDQRAVEEYDRCLLLLRDLAEKKGFEQQRGSAFRAVLLGPANAGKSSLFNHLVGEARAIVSDQRGTTRDVLDAIVWIDDQQVHLFDTAGEGVSDSPADRRAAEHRMACALSADLLLWVQPMAEHRSGPGPELAGLPVLHVATFADLGYGRVAEDVLLVSSQTGEGVSALRQALAHRAEGRSFARPAMPVSARQGAWLTEAHEGAQRARSALLSEEPAELIAAELRLALDALLQVTGEWATRAVLDEVFSSFCIGK